MLRFRLKFRVYVHFENFGKIHEKIFDIIESPVDLSSKVTAAFSRTRNTSPGGG